MSIVPCPEKEGQLDFFEPRVSDGDKLQTLFSLLLQSGVKPGLYEIEPSILPERGWQLVSDLERAKVSKKDSDAIASKAKGYGLDDVDVISVASAPEYGINIAKAPRPARILRSPIPLTIEEMQGLKVLSQNPIERLEDAWWEEARAPNEPGLKRDYYFAVSMEGQCLWIFQDLNSDEYFVHGYFD
jgi:protein ImuB